jgi:preprotein translocase subunit SecG
MTIAYYTLIGLILFVCFVLAITVLAQNPKGGGLSSQFGAGGAANLMGVKRTGDLLEKMTWGCAIALVVFSLGTHILGAGNAGPVRSVNQQKALETRTPALPAPLPAAPGGGATAPGRSAQSVTPGETPASQTPAR